MVKTSDKTSSKIISKKQKDIGIKEDKIPPLKKTLSKKEIAVKKTDTSTKGNKIPPPKKNSSKKDIVVKKDTAVKKTDTKKNINKKNNINSDDKSKKDNRILEVKTTQTGALKQVIERICNVISDCCIVFIPPDSNQNDDDDDDDDYFEEVELPQNSKNKSVISKKSRKNKDDSDEEEDDSDEEEDDDEKEIDLKNKPKNSTSKKSKNTGGIRILRLTEDKSILIKLNLDAKNFDDFRCDEPKITIGVDMHNLHAHLKMVNDDDPIVLYMNKDNRSALYIRSLNENNESCEETDIEIYLMEIGNPEWPIPKTVFQNKITMASDKFHTICKHLNNNSTFVEIMSVNNEISFKGQNEGGKVTMSYKDVNYTKKKDQPDQVVQGVYELRNLMGFSKCNKLCPTIEIYLKNDFPLVLVISVATLGKMYVFLSPIDNGNN